MRLLARHGDLEPAHALNAGYDPDLLAFGFEHRTLFDMKFEESGQRMSAARLGSVIADRRKRLTERNSRAILLLARPAWIENSGEHARGDQRRGEARALLVGPVDNLDRRISLVTGFDERAQRLKSGEHAQHAIELAACRLRVEVAAHCDRRELGV